MGSGISLVNIQKGIKTRLKDLNQESLGKSEKHTKLKIFEDKSGDENISKNFS